MGWPVPFLAIIEHLKETTNKRLLIEILLSHPDGNFAAEGMVMVVQEQLPDAEKLLSRYFKDQRSSELRLIKNSYFSRISLLAWKIKQNRPLTTEEKVYLVEDEEFIRSLFYIQKYQTKKYK